jgi:hypothetical protein
VLHTKVVKPIADGTCITSAKARFWANLKDLISSRMLAAGCRDAKPVTTWGRFRVWVRVLRQSHIYLGDRRASPYAEDELAGTVQTIRASSSCSCLYDIYDVIMSYDVTLGCCETSSA